MLNKSRLLIAFAVIFSCSFVFSAPAKRNTRKSVITFAPSDAARQKPETEQLSLEKENFIRDLIKKYIAAGEDIMNKDVENAIIGDVARSLTLNPKTKMDGRKKIDLQNEARKSILPKYPKTVQQFREDFAKSLESKYKMFKIRDKVTIRYRRGNSTYIVSGTFYSFNGRTVRIGSRNVPYYDVIPEDKIRVNRNYRDELYQAELTRNVNEYREKRSDAIYRATNTLFQKQFIANHKAGYIHYFDNWMSPEALTRYIIDRERVKISVLASGLPDDDSEFNLSIDKPKEADVLDKVEKYRQEFAKMNLSGIDSERGQGAAYWGFSRGETKLALRLVSNIITFSRETYDYYFSSNRQIKDIRLDYNANKLCRVVITYNDIRNLQDFNRIRAFYLRSYGKDDASKKGKVIPEGEVVSLYWTGKYTKGSLDVKFNSEDEMIESISFIKEDVSNPWHPKKKLPVPGKKK